jgi:hypothetical protein
MPSLPFSEMWRLTVTYHTDPIARRAFPIGLLIGIFWHESRFMNIRQRFRAGLPVGGHGVGFGQSERTSIGMVNDHYRIHGPRYPLDSSLTDQQSIEIAGLTLRAHMEIPRLKTLNQTLHAYATGDTPSSRRPPGPTVRGWLVCEEALRFLGKGPSLVVTDPAVERTIKAALLMAAHGTESDLLLLRM